MDAENRSEIRNEIHSFGISKWATIYNEQENRDSEHFCFLANCGFTGTSQAVIQAVESTEWIVALEVTSIANSMIGNKFIICWIIM